MLSDDELRAEITDIDVKLESQSAWLTPRYRSGLLAAREVLIGVLDRRRRPWPGLIRRAPQPPAPSLSPERPLPGLVVGETYAAE